MNDHIRFMNLAWDNSRKATCERKQVGAVLVYTPQFNLFKGASIMFEGWGGAKEPCARCDKDDWTWRQDGCRSIHAEVRALLLFLESKEKCRLRFEDCVMYVTHGPCDQCLKYMAYFGVPRVMYDEPYHNDYSKWRDEIEVCRLDKNTGELIREV